jgi:hypothetical protein
MAVVAAGVHGPFVFRPVIYVVFLRDGQCVHVGAKSCGGRISGGLAAFEQGAKATVRNRDDLARQGGKMIHDVFGRLRQVVTQLGNTVQITPVFHESFLIDMT